MQPESSPEPSSRLLINKYSLHLSPEVNAAAKRTKARSKNTLDEVSAEDTGPRSKRTFRENDPFVRIQNYFERLHEITEREDPKAREHGMHAIKRLLHRKSVIKPHEIPESYWNTQRHIKRDHGQAADLQGPNWEKFKRENTEVIIADQKASLDIWIDYLTSSDAFYPDALKYWALRSIVSMSQYDNGKGTFPPRSKGTTKPFPELDPEALAYVIDAVDKKYRSQDIDLSWLKVGDREQFGKLLEGENFARMYAWAIEKTKGDSLEEQRQITDGEWTRYPQYRVNHNPDGSVIKDALYAQSQKTLRSLVNSLQNKQTGWCTAAETVAEGQLTEGDFYVYYSYRSEEEADAARRESIEIERAIQEGRQPPARRIRPTNPRVAIRMRGQNIAEVRGVANQQNLDSYIAPTVEQKLKEFPDGEAYKKKVSDMKRLTDIDHKIQADTPLDASELAFLYEIDTPIEGFGFNNDPRIEELRNKRIAEVGIEHDLPIIFACEPSQIARSPSAISENTRVYIGPLDTGIFNRLAAANVEHIYLSFPDRKARVQSIEIGEHTSEELLAQIAQKVRHIDPRFKMRILSPDFTIFPTAQKVNVIRLSIQDMGITELPTIEQIISRARELGLTLCPAVIGAEYILQGKFYDNEQLTKILFMDPQGDLQAITTNNLRGNIYLSTNPLEHGRRYDNMEEFLFSFPSSEQ